MYVRTMILAASAVMSLVSGIAHAEGSAIDEREFIGTWVNADKGSYNIRKIKIAASGEGAPFKIRVDAICTPLPCKWGTLNGQRDEVAAVTIRAEIPSNVEGGDALARRELNMHLTGDSKMDYEFTTFYVGHPEMNPHVVRGSMMKLKKRRA